MINTTQTLLTIALATATGLGTLGGANLVQDQAQGQAPQRPDCPFSQECACPQAGLFAQAGPQNPRQGAGQPGQARRPVRPAPPAAILMDPKVHEELRLTDNQVAQVRAVFDEARPAQPPGQGPRGGRGQGPGSGSGQAQGQGQGPAVGPGQGQRPGGQRGQAGPRDPDPSLKAEIDAKIKAVLQPAQWARYQQLELQFLGPPALLSPEVGEKLSITEEQRADMMAILQQNRPQPDPGQAPLDPAAMQARRDQAMAKLLAVLTPAQQSTWASLVGEKFTFSPPRPPRQGGGAGRPGTPPPVE